MPSEWGPPAVDDDGRFISRERAERPVRESTFGGLVAAAVWCVVLGLYSGLLAFASLLIGFVSDSCGSRGPCDNTLLTVGIFIGLVGCPVVAIASIVVAIVRGRRRRAFTWVVPLIGTVGATLVFFVAATVGYAAADINFWSQ